ncbi:MAG: HD domain-containing protein [Candidatus Methanoperedens sp.]|nr:HD domain-containing protein [Candidatus Methanoperedens sp.]
MAALCHDIGHMPFSHTAEIELLPEGWDHERLTIEIIHSENMENIWSDIKIKSEDVAKLAVGPKKFKDPKFGEWETILSEIITGNSFGVDRMDYLLRDSYHAGVAYGKFDHYRLIDTIRILPKTENGSVEPALGIEEGGLHSAEALLLARYFMYTQLYFHSVRRTYDIHLRDFLKKWLEDGYFHTAIQDHLRLNDNEILTALFKASENDKLKGYDSARRIINRDHFKLIYERNPRDIEKNPDVAKAVFHAACSQFGDQNVRIDSYRQTSQGHDFPVITGDKQILSSLELSDTLKMFPIVAVDYVFINPEFRNEAEKWKEQNLKKIIMLKKEGK